MRLLIGLHGDAGAGKDSVADFILEWFHYNYGSSYNARRYSFAKPVYELAAVILGVTPEFLARRNGKETNQWFHVTQSSLERARNVWNKYGLDRYEDFAYVWPIFEDKYLNPQSCFNVGGDGLYSLYISPRKMLQLIGTELGRELVSQSIWTDTLLFQLEQDVPDAAVVTDVRFDNEGVIIHDNGLGFQPNVLHVVSAMTTYSIKTSHPSEGGINPKLFTHAFENKFEGLDNLRTDVIKYCEKNFAPMIG